MARGAGRITELQIGEAVLRVLARSPSGSLTITRLKAEIPDHVALSAADRAPSLTRPGEEMWEQQVRNLVSHRGVPGNIIAEGYADYRPRWLTITHVGRIHVR